MRVLVKRGVGIVSLVALLATAAGCNSNNGLTTITPSPATKTDSFSGSIAQGGSAAHSFTVGAAGIVTVTVTSVGPLATMGVGVSLASWDGTNCGTALQSNGNSKAGSQAVQGSALAGNYCVRIYDSGNIPPDWTVTYSVDVLHP